MAKLTLVFAVLVFECGEHIVERFFLAFRAVAAVTVIAVIAVATVTAAVIVAIIAIAVAAAIAVTAVIRFLPRSAARGLLRHETARLLN